MISKDTIKNIKLITVGDFIYIGVLEEKDGKSTISKRFEVTADCTEAELKDYVLKEYEESLPEPLTIMGLTSLATCPLTRRQKHTLETIVNNLTFELETADKTLKASLLKGLL